MLVSAISLLVLASSALAVTIETPSGWTSSGPNELKFETVATDPTSWAITLVNQNKTLLSSSLVLVKNQTASTTTLSLTPDCASGNTSYPVGAGFQVNFIRDAENLNSIIGQSTLFNITQSPSSSSGCQSSSTVASSTSVAAGESAPIPSASQTGSDQRGVGFPTTSISTSALALAWVGVVGSAWL